jgi:hypothetical protein
MGKRGREELEEGLRLQAISGKSGSPMNVRGGLKKEDCFLKPSPKTPPRLIQGVDGESIHL